MSNICLLSWKVSFIISQEIPFLDLVNDSTWGFPPNQTILEEDFTANEVSSNKQFLIKSGEVTKGLAYQYKYFGAIRFDGDEFKIV